MAQHNATTAPGYTEIKGYVQVTSLASAAGVGTVPDGATFALITPETQSIRWRDDGVDPTASVGMPLAAGATLQYTGKFSALKMIETSASAKVNITYYK